MVQGFGERLQQKRSSIKLSQKEVANAVGVNPIMKTVKGLQAWKSLWLSQASSIVPLTISSVLKKHPVQVLMFRCSMMNNCHACNIFFPV